jgi:uncharacterized protein YndB with AHSA1/START domain
MTTASARIRVIEPVRASVEIAVPPARAFELFIKRMSEWWPLEYAMVPTPREIIIEGKKGGRWYERGSDGTERDVATVTTWQPPGKVSFNWHIDANWQPNPKLATAVDVWFVPTSKGTRVEMEHRDLERFGAQAEATRASLDGKGGWGDLLIGFAKIAKKTERR